MLKQSNINAVKVQNAIEALRSMAENDDYSNRLLVLGTGKGSVADISMSKDEEIIKIRKNVNQIILEDK